MAASFSRRGVRDLVLELAVVRRCLHATDAQARARFVDEVDRLVREVTVGDVAVGEVRRGHERLVGDRDPVVLLVAVAQTLQDLDGVRDGRLLDLDGLEAPLERGVLLEVLAVLVERGRADGLELAAGEHRLEDAGGVDRALCGTRPDERVELVDEQDDVAAGADLLQHLLEPLLEVAAVAGTGHQGPEVERVELLALQSLGHLTADDVGGETLDDCGLADAGLTDEHRVVLGAARQHLHDALDLLLAPDHRVELLVARELREVAAELVEHERAALGGLGRGAPTLGRALLGAGVARQELDDLLADAREVGAQLDEDLRGDALTLADEPEQDVLGADVVVAELQRFAERQLEDLLGAGGERDVARRRGATVTDDLLDLGAHGFERDAERLERLGGHSFALVDQAEQDVLRPDVVVVEQARFFLRQDDHSAGSVGKAFEHGWDPPLSVGRTPVPWPHRGVGCGS